MLIRQKTTAGIFKGKVLEFLGSGEDQKDEVCSNYMNFIVEDGSDGCLKMLGEHIGEGFRKGEWDEVSFGATPVGSLSEKVLRHIPDQGVTKKIAHPVSCAG